MIYADLDSIPFLSTFAYVYIFHEYENGFFRYILLSLWVDSREFCGVW